MPASSFDPLRVGDSDRVKIPGHAEMPASPFDPLRGRGAVENPPNRFETLRYAPDPEGEEEGGQRASVPTAFLRDASRSVLTRNDSPDVGLDVSLNPDRCGPSSSAHLVRS